MLERPTLATFSSLPAHTFYPRNSRGLFRPSFASSVLIVPPRRKRSRKRDPHSHESSSGTHRDTQGKAPRSTPPTIGLLSCYFLPTRRTTPASSRRWLRGPYMDPRPGGKSPLPRRVHGERELSYSPRWLPSLFAPSRAWPPSFLRGTADSRFVFLYPTTVSEPSRTINDGTLEIVDDNEMKQQLFRRDPLQIESMRQVLAWRV